MTSWPSALINILLGSTSAACLGETGWGEFWKHKKVSFPVGRFSSWQREGKAAEAYGLPLLWSQGTQLHLGPSD